MRRFLNGCHAVFALLFEGGGIATYVFRCRPALQLVQKVRLFQQIGDLKEQVQDDSTYRPPSDGAMTAEQLDRYLAALILDAKRAQVDALNQVGFSLSEYVWVRAHKVGALGYASYARFDVKELVDAAQQGEDLVRPAQVRVRGAVTWFGWMPT